MQLSELKTTFPLVVFAKCRVDEFSVCEVLDPCSLVLTMCWWIGLGGNYVVRWRNILVFLAV